MAVLMKPFDISDSVFIFIIGIKGNTIMNQFFWCRHVKKVVFDLLKKFFTVMKIVFIYKTKFDLALTKKSGIL